MPPGPPSLMQIGTVRPPGFPPMPAVPAPPPTQAKQDDEPPAKKQKTEDQLVPEDEWLRRNKVNHVYSLSKTVYQR